MMVSGGHIVQCTLLCTGMLRLTDRDVHNVQHSQHDTAPLTACMRLTYLATNPFLLLATSSYSLLPIATNSLLLLATSANPLLLLAATLLFRAAYSLHATC